MVESSTDKDGEVSASSGGSVAGVRARLGWRALTLFWGASFVLLILVVWQLSSVLLPFVAGALIAYFLNPVVDMLSRRRVPRLVGTLVVALVFFVLLIVLMMTVAPALAVQLLDFGQRLPVMLESMEQNLVPQLTDLGVSLGISADDLRAQFTDVAYEISNFISRNVGSAITGVGGLVSIVAFLVLTPVVAIYLLYDFPRMISGVDQLIPRGNRSAVHRLARGIDDSVSSLIRGLATVAIIMSVLYTIGFFAVGYKFALLSGILLGFGVFVPYLGTISVAAVSVVLAWLANGLWQEAALVLVVCVVGQSFEGYFLTPRLVGRKLGLHPVWIIFSLLAGGALAGLAGILLAMPVAAAFAATVRFGLSYYRDSSIYLHDAP